MIVTTRCTACGQVFEVRQPWNNEIITLKALHSCGNMTPVVAISERDDDDRRAGL